MYITKSWLIGELSLYSENEFVKGAILPKVTIYKPIKSTTYFTNIDIFYNNIIQETNWVFISNKLYFYV